VHFARQALPRERHPGSDSPLLNFLRSKENFPEVKRKEKAGWLTPACNDEGKDFRERVPQL